LQDQNGSPIYQQKKRNKTVVIRKSHEKILQNFEEKKLFQHFANLIKIRSTHLLPILDLIIPPLPEGGGGYTVLPKWFSHISTKKHEIKLWS
jgi:hypothetical protein